MYFVCLVPNVSTDFYKPSFLSKFLEAHTVMAEVVHSSYLHTSYLCRWYNRLESQNLAGTLAVPVSGQGLCLVGVWWETGTESWGLVWTAKTLPFPLMEKGGRTPYILGFF